MSCIFAIFKITARIPILPPLSARLESLVLCTPSTIPAPDILYLLPSPVSIDHPAVMLLFSIDPSDPPSAVAQVIAATILLVFSMFESFASISVS